MSANRTKRHRKASANFWKAQRDRDMSDSHRSSRLTSRPGRFHQNRRTKFILKRERRMTKKGYFSLTDISGYTEFLTKSELDHAQEALQNLFDVQLAHIKHPFVISGFRGDAIFMYVPETNFCEPQALLESLETLYFVFADARRQMIYNTTCTCRACQNISRLDLKMVVHYGEYVLQKLGDREELLGADVIVPHRMLKNDVIEQTGIKAYALFSEAAANFLRLSELSQPLIQHTENYEHLG